MSINKRAGYGLGIGLGALAGAGLGGTLGAASGSKANIPAGIIGGGLGGAYMGLMGMAMYKAFKLLNDRQKLTTMWVEDEEERRKKLGKTASMPKQAKLSDMSYGQHAAIGAGTGAGLVALASLIGAAATGQLKAPHLLKAIKHGHALNYLKQYALKPAAYIAPVAGVAAGTGALTGLGVGAAAKLADLVDKKRAEK